MLSEVQVRILTPSIHVGITGISESGFLTTSLYGDLDRHFTVTIYDLDLSACPFKTSLKLEHNAGARVNMQIWHERATELMWILQASLWNLSDWLHIPWSKIYLSLDTMPALHAYSYPRLHHPQLVSSASLFCKIIRSALYSLCFTVSAKPRRICVKKSNLLSYIDLSWPTWSECPSPAVSTDHVHTLAQLPRLFWTHETTPTSLHREIANPWYFPVCKALTFQWLRWHELITHAYEALEQSSGWHKGTQSHMQLMHLILLLVLPCLARVLAT